MIRSIVRPRSVFSFSFLAFWFFFCSRGQGTILISDHLSDFCDLDDVLVDRLDDLHVIMPCMQNLRPSLRQLRTGAQ